jgi:hypothetical protein
MLAFVVHNCKKSNMRKSLWLIGAAVLAMTLGAAPAIGQRFSGTGQQATGLFTLNGGLVVWEMEHRGEGRFTVRLLEESGTLVEELVSHTGKPFVGSKAIRVPRTGRYLLDIAASHDWSIGVRGTSAAAPTFPAARADSAAPTQGAYAGAEAARRQGALGWMGTGFLGGVVLGPIGAGLAFATVSSRSAELPPATRATLAGHSPEYAAAFMEAFRDRLRSERRTAVLVGGATGTAVFLFIIAQIANWNDTGGGATNGGTGEVP